ncbi:UDP-glucose 4-epimerase GalE [Tabrizicola sp.]|uniref:UDP-glucose 4-epimerase GalE n=1 Tax=Tabrizicola sp. TaxID=2005166 RepID=UPI00286BD213|nr:UDP-glucose 4-epimerase GalE [Tabrizicola sp.]
MVERVLVTGGAGYIGAHACKALRLAGFEPVTFDNLSTGWAGAVQFGPLVQGDLADRAALDRAFADHQPVAVMHFAALSLVGEAMTDPGRYWRANVGGALNLIEAAVAAGCGRFVFSSTCATYGDHDGVMLDEDTVQRPINAYGASKRAIEDILANFGMSHGLRHVAFRYFNVAGGDPDGEVGEQHRPETHLIPLVLETIAGTRPFLTVHGTDYPTPDGTCVRDYVHVMDLAEAHVLGLRWLLDGGQSRAFNLGSGRGFSVREVLDHASVVTNREVPVVLGPRRAGDAAMLVSGSDRAMRDLGWAPSRSTLPQMIADAWRWSQGKGYDS